MHLDILRENDQHMTDLDWSCVFLLLNKFLKVLVFLVSQYNHVFQSL